MARRDADRGEPLLFDLPLTPGAGEEAEDGPAEAGEGELPLVVGEESPKAAAGGAAREAGSLGRSTAAPPAPELEPPDPPAEDAGAALRAAEPLAAVPPIRGPLAAPFPPRLLAALADLAVHGCVALIGWAGAAVAGVRIGAAELPALGVFLLAFSFLYSVVSLAFWGKTPGMAAAGVVSRGAGGQPLTFGQTGLRWLGGVVTALLAGLPLLLALTGRSLPDRLSGSRTFRLR